MKYTAIIIGILIGLTSAAHATSYSCIIERGSTYTPTQANTWAEKPFSENFYILEDPDPETIYGPAQGVTHGLQAVVENIDIDFVLPCHHRTDAHMILCGNSTWFGSDLYTLNLSSNIITVNGYALSDAITDKNPAREYWYFGIGHCSPMP